MAYLLDMTTLLVTHQDMLAHDTGPGHPERAERLRAISDRLAAADFAALRHAEPAPAESAAIQRIHPAHYLETLTGVAPTGGAIFLDDDTIMAPGSLQAALLAAGCGIRAVDEVFAGAASNAFCAVRPPGHHAEPARAMGFCLFNNVAIAAMHARAAHGAERVAVIDFDAHHGNGTQASFWHDRNAFYASTHQMPLFPGSGAAGERGEYDTIVNAPLHAGDQGWVFRQAVSDRVLPALAAFAPDVIFVSAGFDAHRDDPLASIQLDESDFAWVTQQLVDAAERHCGGRLISMLEGGYNIQALAASVAAHVGVLMGRTEEPNGGDRQ